MPATSRGARNSYRGCGGEGHGPRLGDRGAHREVGPRLGRRTRAHGLRSATRASRAGSGLRGDEGRAGTGRRVAATGARGGGPAGEGGGEGGAGRLAAAAI